MCVMMNGEDFIEYPLSLYSISSIAINNENIIKTLKKCIIKYDQTALCS